MKAGYDSLSQQNKTSGRKDEKMVHRHTQTEDKKNGAARKSFRYTNRTGSAQEQGQVTSMMETKYAELEKRIMKKHTKLEEQLWKGHTTSWRNHFHEDTREATVLQGTEDAAAAEEKEDAAAAKTQKNHRRGRKKQICMSPVRTEETSQKQTPHRVEGDNTEGFEEQ